MRIGLMVLIIALAAWFAPHPAEGQTPERSAGTDASISVQSAVEVDVQTDLTVGDLAEFKGFAPHEVDELRAIRLGEAPSTSETRKFTDQELSPIFRTHIRELQSRDRKVRLSIPPVVTVSRRAFRLEAKVIEAEIQRQLMAQCRGCEIEVVHVSMPILPENLKAASKWELRMRSELPRGTFSAPLEIQSAEGRRLFWVTGEIRVWRRVPVAKRTIQINERMQISDIEIERRDVTYLSDTFPEESELSEVVAARGITAGGLIGRSMIRREQALRAGQPVRVIAGDDTWRVSVDGLAQQAGSVGDVIRVKIPSTQKIVSGILIEKGLIEVQQ